MATIKKNGGYNALPIGYKRGNPIPLDTTAVWWDLDELKAYASTSPVAYVGQILSCVDEVESTVSAYLILNTAGDLLKLATTSASGDIAEDLAKLTTRVGNIETSLGTPTIYYVEGDTLPSGKKVGDVKTEATGVFKLIDTKADKGTTLDDYGITDAYTKEETDKLITGVFSFKGDASLEYEYTEVSTSYNPDETYYTKNSDGTYTKVEIEEFTKGTTYYTASWTGNLLDSKGSVIAGKAGAVYQVNGETYAYRDDDGNADSSDRWVKLGIETNLSSYATKSYVNTKVNPVIKTVGDSTSGLVKDVADLKTAVGEPKTDTTVATGLYKADADLSARLDVLEAIKHAPEDAEKNVINSVSNEFAVSSTRELSVNQIDHTKIGGLGTLAVMSEVPETSLASALKDKINGKADQATTLAGYGITDAKIEDGVIALGSKTITPITDVSDKLNIGKSTDSAGIQSYYGIEADIANVKTDLVGASTDGKGKSTIYGAKAYADDAVDTLKTELEGSSTDTWDTNKTLYAVKNYTDSKGTELIGASTDTSDKDTIYGAKAMAKAAQDTADKKVASVTAGNDGITIGGTSTDPTVGIKVSSKSGNLLEIDTKDGEKGLYVSAPTAAEYTIVKAETAANGYLATYYLTKDDTKVGVDINIPKDYLVKSAYIGTCTVAGTPEGCSIGDKYIDFVINSSDANGNESHLYLRVQDLVDTYTSGNGISISNANVVSAKVVAQNGLSVDTDGIKLSLATETSAGAMDKSDKIKLDNIESEAQVNKIESVSTGDGALTISNKGVAIPTATAALLGLVKGSGDENKVSVGTDGTMSVNSLNVSKLVQTEGDYLVVDGGTATLITE